MDSGGGYTSEEFQGYCIEKKITCHFMTIYTPQQNIVYERLNRIVLEKVRSMISESDLPGEFLTKSVNTTIYLSRMSLWGSLIIISLMICDKKDHMCINNRRNMSELSLMKLLQ